MIIAIDGPAELSWAKIKSVVEHEQRQLTSLLADRAAGRLRSPLGSTEQFDLVLGIACHAVYHAGQIQLIKRLRTT